MRILLNSLHGFTWATSLACLVIMAPHVSACQSESKNEDKEKDKSDLPAWVNQGTFHQDDCDYLLVQTEGCNTPLEANNELNQQIKQAIAKILDQNISPTAGQQITFSEEYIRDHLLRENRSIVKPYKDEFTTEMAERLGKEYGEFYRGYAQLRLDDSFYQTAERRWLRETTRVRLLFIALYSMIAFALLTTTYGFLRLNHATRGFYSNRLFTIGLSTLLLLAAITLWIMSRVSW